MSTLRSPRLGLSVDEPRRGELLNVERLEERARALAATSWPAAFPWEWSAK